MSKTVEINEADQWKLGGQCKICRRNMYCSKQCRANRIAIEMIAMEIIKSDAFRKLAQAKEENNNAEV